MIKCCSSNVVEGSPLCNVVERSCNIYIQSILSNSPPVGKGSLGELLERMDY